jgi:hypothetical protein
VGRWYYAYSNTSATALTDAAYNQDAHTSYGLASDNGGLALPSQISVSTGSKVASASSFVAATAIGAGTTAVDALDPDSTLVASTAVAVIHYRAVLSSPDPVTLDFHLSGQLNVVGDRSLGTDPSRAAVAVAAVGSLTDAAPGAYDALFANIGLVPVDGLFTLDQYAAWPTSTQRNLATAGAQASTAHLEQIVDTHFSVTADGTLIDCAPGLAPVCGNYFFFFTVFMVAGSENGGLADFTHTLSVEAIHAGAQAPVSFEPTALPVPEPATALLWLAGLCSLGALRHLLRHPLRAARAG